ncbi:MAG: acetyl/propionyl/methylcrotonyl-CoA carboxylase subunit alpha [Rhodospirillales bacterium]|jgi:propionyl-CoA carboxylase alpha chain|nr:acetyl/propionyl/methylcrotonyl-CoA carboxylase subunit alpha [Rhodospirillales bacterium]
MFKKILIANRGEIACRVMRTARRLGIATVAVHSEADRDALHVEMADEAVCIGPPPATESYLRADRIVRAALDTGAEAVHPGYGFLSENAAFARRLAREGIVFIGPGARAIAAMGDKIKAKRLALGAGVSIIPGPAEAIGDARAAVRAAKRLGYPVMLKAAAGGGGRGMRIARSDAEVRDGLRSAAREAKASFGDGRIFIETYVERPRHIEIQVLADSHASIVHLGERECSIQRRHQKIIEEAPSPFIDADTRAAMGEQAVALARAAGYVSAGTVEFVVDEERNFYFLEMNTRLQVEHPVTELITGLDLVEQMIVIAAGEKLAFSQADLRLDGWAVEARVYAEDPLRGFLPSVGRLVAYAEPAEDGGVRVDSGVHEGGEISIHYDPLIAKVIAHGADRDTAIERLRGALDTFRIRGVSNNICFLAAVAGHPGFGAGDINTGFIDEAYPDGFHASDVPHDDPALLAAVAVSMHRAYTERGARIGGQVPGHPPTIPDAWVALIGDERFAVTAAPTDGGFDVVVDDEPYQVRTDWSLAQPLFRAVINGVAVTLQVERAGAGYRIIHSGLDVDVLVLTRQAARHQTKMPAKKRRQTSRHLLSPMPGLLRSVAVAVGQEVQAGEELAVVEAMKMENVLRAARDGTVAAVHARPGDQVALDQPIIEFAGKSR